MTKVSLGYLALGCAIVVASVTMLRPSEAPRPLDDDAERAALIEAMREHPAFAEGGEYATGAPVVVPAAAPAKAKDSGTAARSAHADPHHPSHH